MTRHSTSISASKDATSYGRNVAECYTYRQGYNDVPCHSCINVCICICISSYMYKCMYMYRHICTGLQPEYLHGKTQRLICDDRGVVSSHMLSVVILCFLCDATAYMWWCVVLYVMTLRLAMQIWQSNVSSMCVECVLILTSLFIRAYYLLDHTQHLNMHINDTFRVVR